MLQKLFLWFYCLSIADALALIILISSVYLLLRQRLRENPFWRPIIVLLLVAWIAVTVAATLTDRIPGGVPMEPQLLPFHSYRVVLAGGSRELLRSNFMNAVLFFPTGLLACELLPGSWSRFQKAACLAALSALVSVGIEFCQYRYALGQAEIDDVIHNMLGAWIGVLAGTIHIDRS